MNKTPRKALNTAKTNLIMSLDAGPLHKKKGQTNGIINFFQANKFRFNKMLTTLGATMKQTNRLVFIN